MKILLRVVFMATLLLFAAASFSQTENKTVKLRSPNGRIEIEFSLNNADAPTYAVAYDKRTIIARSTLGLEFKTGGLLSKGVKITDTKRRKHDETYTLVVGKSKQARDYYNELIVSLEERAAPKRKLQIIFRAYDDGAAFRYLIPQQTNIEKFEITAEQSEFRFPEDYTCWAARLKNFKTNYEKEFDKINLSQIAPNATTGLPLTVQVDENLILALAEADLDDYAGMYLQGIDGEPPALVSRLSPLPKGETVCVRAVAPHKSPWRVVMIGDTPGKLIESNLILNLNPPNTIADASWIKPGKSAWAWWSGQMATNVNFTPGMNDATVKYYIDFAAEYNLEYMLIDAGWYTERAYGENADTKADATKSIPEINLPALVDHAKRKNVGIIVWLHWVVARDQMDVIFPFYERIGVKGVKIDFMDRDDQEMVAFYHRVLKKAAEHHLVVDLHGAYKPTGLMRTFPNYLTQEGVKGAEHNKWSADIVATHNLTLPFTRMLTGPMDYTPGGFRNVTKEQFKIQDNAPMVKTTRAHQLAMYVVYESFLQMVADFPGAYRGEAGAEFLRVVPTSWDETRVLTGSIGEYVVIARRRGRDWFIGAMTNETGRTLQLPLNFLSKGAYTMTSYADGTEAAIQPTQISISKKKVAARETLTVQLAPSGGFAAHLEAAKKEAR